MAVAPGLVDVTESVGLSAVAYGPDARAWHDLVHHGGAGTTAVGLRSGIPTLILSTWGDQAVWDTRARRLKVVLTRRFSATTRNSLVAICARNLRGNTSRGPVNSPPE